MFGRCKCCQREARHELIWGYCFPCFDELREMYDEQRARWRELDEESAQSYAEYEFKEDEGGEANIEHLPYTELEDCNCCGASLGPYLNWVWHYEDEDCRAIRKPRELGDN